MAISSVAGYCAFLGIVGAATFWLIARPDHARWRGRSGEPFANFKNEDAFREEAKRARGLGMVGKWAIHPAQIALANEVSAAVLDAGGGDRRSAEAVHAAGGRSGAGAKAGSRLS
jgi:citrate lyase beta subunit